MQWEAGRKAGKTSRTGSLCPNYLKSRREYAFGKGCIAEDYIPVMCVLGQGPGIIFWKIFPPVKPLSERFPNRTSLNSKLNSIL